MVTVPEASALSQDSPLNLNFSICIAVTVTVSAFRFCVDVKGREGGEALVFINYSSD